MALSQSWGVQNYDGYKTASNNDELHNVCWLRFGCNLKRRKHLGWAVVCKFVFAVSCIFERFEFGTNFLENGNASHLKDANRL